MSVPKNKRTDSKFQVYENAIKFRAIMTNLVLKDFGVKNRVKDLKIISKDMPPDLCFEIENLLTKYNLDEYESQVSLQYPTWFLEQERNIFTTYLAELVRYICEANKIYISTMKEYEERRILIDKAICTCHSLLQEMRFISDTFRMPKEKMVTYINMLDVEINLLKKWRQSDNHFAKKIQDIS